MAIVNADSSLVLAQVRGLQGPAGEVTTAAMNAAIAAAITAIKNGVDPAGDTLAELYALILLRATLASPALTGNPTAPTQAEGTGNTRIATTFYADRAASNAAALRLALTGGTLNGALILAADPLVALGAATKQYVDSVAAGLDVKPSVRFRTTANVNLASGGIANGTTHDGVTAATGDRVLVASQSAPAENGIYIVPASGAASRATDMDAWAEVPGAFCFIELGTTYADTAFVCTANAGGTLNTTAITFSQFAGAGTYSAGTGLTLTGTTFAIDSTVCTLNGTQTLTNKTFSLANNTLTGTKAQFDTALSDGNFVFQSDLAANVATFLATPSSANLLAAITDETGTGALVFATSPTLTTPNIGVASGTSLSVNSGGNIGLGGTNQRLALSHAGSTEWGLAIKETDGTNGASMVSFINSANSVTGNITRTNATTIAYNTSSDRDLKTDERPFTRAGEIVDALQVWDFRWKDSEDRGIGVFAQDAFEVFPDAITRPQEDGVPWQADYSKFVPVLIAALQDARTRIAALEARLSEKS